MTTTQTSAQLLDSLAAQIGNAETATEYHDLYLLARGVYYTESDRFAGLSCESVTASETEALVELRGSWNDLLLVVKEIDDQDRFPVSNEGFVSFSDGSSYGGRK
jgi:hypothetical protein